MEIMREVDIQNIELLGLLDEWITFIFADKPLNDFDGSKFYDVGQKNPDHMRDDYISDKYKNKIINMGVLHDGFPESGKFWDLRMPPRDGYSAEGRDGYVALDNKMMATLATKFNALAAVSPPGGFLAWHNNANAASYNLILTWSENGNGHFKYVNPHTGDTVTVQDKPGWQCKAFYFGCYSDSPNDLVYHSASSDCWRLTCSYVFDRTHKQFWEDIIEEIETP